MITVKNLRKSFGKVEVLKDINAEIKEKEVVCANGNLVNIPVP
jgi:ABC-type polar amino acid transport system ATPase subunit